MATERLNVVLELVSGQYKREAKEAAVATGQISTAAGSANTSVSRMATSAGRAGSLIRVGFAAVAGSAVLDVLGNLDQLGQKMEATERMAETVFGNMVDDARAWADQNNEAFGIGENALLSLFAKTQDLLVPMGFVREEALGMSKEILNVANALSEWEGGTISAEDAQLRLAKAMLGEREGLVELGVKITDAEVKAELAARGLDKLTGAARQQAIAQVTLTLVTNKSTDALKAYENRAGTATAAQKELTASTADASESWAQLLRGPMDEAKGTFADVVDIAQFLSEKMDGVARGSDEAATGGSGLVRIWEVMTPVGALLQEVLSKIADATESTVEPSHNAAEAARFMADAQKDDLIPVVFNTIKMLDNQNASHRNVAKAADTQRTAMINLANAQADLLDPLGNVLRLQKDLKDAQERLTEVQEDSKSTLSDLAIAAIEVEQAQLRLNAAGAALSADPIQAFALILINQLGMSEQQALDTLAALELLDGWTGHASFTLEMNTIASGGGGGGNINTDILRLHGGGIVPGPRGSDQLIVAQGGEGVLSLAQMSRGGSTTSNAFGGTVIVMSPSNNLPQDLQYGALLANHATFGKF